VSASCSAAPQHPLLVEREQPPVVPRLLPHERVAIDGHAIAVKLGLLGDELVNVAPEHDNVARAAAELGRPAKTVWAQAWTAAERTLSGRRRSP
jgi:uncharacterized protein (DUF111 family)